MSAQLVFLLYDNRSGSTYLSALLNRYKGVSVSLESRFVAHIIEYPGRIDSNNPEPIIEYLGKEVQFNELGLDADELARSLTRENNLTRKKLIQTIISQYFSKRDPEAECMVIKHAPYAYLHSVIELFPDVQFLQIIRDGRAVFNSKKKTKSLDGTKMETNPLKAAWDWRLKLKKTEQFAARTINIFYEDLVMNQDKALSDVLEQLNISDEGRTVTKEQSDYFRSIGKAQKRLHQNVSRPPQKKVINKWKQELSRSEINVYNSVNQQYLRKYHYTIDRPVPKMTNIRYMVYLFEFIMQKIKNIILLLRKPSLLKRKFYRNYLLMKE